MSSWSPVIQSILPRSSPTVSTFPEIGSKAPTAIANIDLPNGTDTPYLVAFVRHCGCPFSNKETKVLAEQVKKHKDLHVIIVQHSDQKESEEWFERIGSKSVFEGNESRYTLVADPERKIYAAWGIGTMGWTGVLNFNLLGKLRELQRVDKIEITPTQKGSWRWQNSGGFAVDKSGTIQWRKLADDAGDMCDYEAAVKTVTR